MAKCADCGKEATKSCKILVGISIGDRHETVESSILACDACYKEAYDSIDELMADLRAGILATPLIQRK
jgi:hypothetical protein